jgi:hypothetical protein
VFEYQNIRQILVGIAQIGLRLRDVNTSFFKTIRDSTYISENQVGIFCMGYLRNNIIVLIIIIVSYNLNLCSIIARRFRLSATYLTLT